jgi:ribosomal protein S6 kinase alpha-5
VLIGKIANTLEYLHSLGIVHRNLKPEGFLMSDFSDTANIKLMDFGFSKLLSKKGTCNDNLGSLV